MGHTKKIIALCAVAAGLLGLSAAPAPADRHTAFGEFTVLDRHQTSVPDETQVAGGRAS
ncbi:MAG TPA: hypothetical protein VNS49_09750 [Streptomyces sp.]|nr:hypothetical protein [Streptomyces sp.]